ncbi:MAG: hypothetical protein CMC70_09835 [Flavobacteriaceae bacterium]|nr:hypothetical protein [Flavobacteriaceae bacterium]|tara:strand:- start:558 stop:887 length:330 start_codon:yes stop_codon:yes gene_type:complete
MKCHAIFSVLLFTIVLISCKSSKPEITENQSTILVQVTEETAVSALETNFKTYGLKYLKVVSRPMFIYLFSYNAEKISEAQLIILLKQEENVTEVQSNKDIEPRKPNKP